jgi:hypothetical protein
MKKERKLIILFFIILIIFTIGIVPKSFQNDTFFNISIGKYILNNGIDMQEHFSWVDGLTYTYSHWAFDIIVYLIYNIGGFSGIYISVVLFAIIINLTLFALLNKKNKSPIVALFVTMVSSYIIKDAYTARSQIVSFLCFIIEIYCIEQFIDTNKKRYAISLIILSVIIANFHAATWPLYLVLFMPYVACEFLNLISFKSIYSKCAKRLEKKLSKTPENSEKYLKYKKDLEYYQNYLNTEHKPLFTKTIRKESYNIKNLIILMIIIAFTGLLTPIHGTPYTYIIHSMFGKSNFESALSIDYISEMQPIIPATNLGICVFSILFIGFLTFMPSKLKSEHGFLVLGLYFMALSSARYVYLLVFLGSYVLCDIITQNVNLLIPDDIHLIENFITKKIIMVLLVVLICMPTVSSIIANLNVNYVNKNMYPVGAVEYIKENLDYKNMKIYNSYNNGSYLMLNDIPVFIDSRLDVYCSEFNDTDVFHDYIYATQGMEYYEDIFSKYDFTHVLLYKNELLNKYIPKDSNYKLLYEDDYFSLYERDV